ncbi:Membrane protein involved in the export of O-antigen and teichoic acid [Tenacibaculum sp. 190130A14a]|uniref:Membrane protein involved in the export of O-antigen and teichoic acid n=1 Tax=Tenacibaculum polynesiense TaxID=3137857 RepID=A0ABP1F7E4_9FLAO
MGIIFKQSLKNTFIIYLGFLIGGINTLILYDRFLTSEYYGLAQYIFAASNIITPLIAFGVHFSIIKFFSAYKTKKQRDKFLSSFLFVPLLIALPIGFFWDYFHNLIMSYVSQSDVEENLIVESYTFYIYIIAVCCAYFEVFYAWAKVQMQSVFGNALKELYNRLATMIMLFAVAFGFFGKEEFLFYMSLAYILRTILMMVYAFRLYFPEISFSLPDNIKEVVKYTVYILLAGSAGAIVLDIDKVMIPGKEGFQVAAFYTVALFIGSFIEAPSRAMTQILQPLTSKSINEENNDEVRSLYKKSSINLLLVGGLFFILVNSNVTELFRVLPNKGYAGGELVVLMISSAKLFLMFLGNNGAIINNSKFYRITLPMGLSMAFLVYYLNDYFYYKLAFGTNGLAFSTLLVTLLVGTFRLWFVHYKMRMNPFTSKTLLIVIQIVVFYVIFNAWNFNIPAFYFGDYAIHPVVNIILKSVIIVPLYFIIAYKLKISKQINGLIERRLQ